MRTNRIQNLMKPLAKCSLQTHFGKGLHTLGLLGWILQQVGRADVYVSTYSTSEEFLAGFHNLKRKGLIAHSVLLADVKASRKTVKLEHLMAKCFDSVYLGENHSKVVLVQTEKGQTVTVLTSQNQTYGGRAECTVVTTSQEVFYDIYCGFKDIVNESVLLNGLFGETAGADSPTGGRTDPGFGDFRPFGLAE